MKILNVLKKIQDWIVIIGLGVMTIITVYSVFNRFILRQAVTWSDEATRYLFIWVSLIGASIGVEENVHANVSVFVDFIPKKVRKYIYIISNVLCVFFCVVMVYTGIQLVIAQSNQVSAAMRINMSVIYLALPVSFILMGINFMANIVKLCIGDNDKEIKETNNADSKIDSQITAEVKK